MEQYTKNIDIAKIWQVLKLNKWIIFSFSGFTTLIAIIYCIFATPIFTASILINPPKLSDAGSGLGLSGFSGGIGFGGGLFGAKVTDADVATALLQTNSVLDMQIKQFNLMKYYKARDIELARKQLISNTKVFADIKSGFLTISVEDKNPKLAADIATYYTISLGKLISNIALGKTVLKSDFFEKQVNRAKMNLTDAENKVKTFARENGIAAGVQSQVIVGLVTQLQSQLVAAQTQLNAMSLYATSENPEYQRLEKQVNSIKLQLVNLNGADSSQDKIAIPAGMAPELAQQYINLMRDFIMQDEIYKLMVKQYEASKLDRLSELDPTAVQVIDPAQVPLHKSKPKRLLIIMRWLILGLFFSIIYVLVKNRKNIIVEGLAK